MRRLAYRVVLADGWVRLGIAFGAGAVGALAMPPFGILPALVASLTVAVWLLDGAEAGGSRPRLASAVRAAAAGWAWGFGYFLGGLWWIGSAFLVQPDLFLPLLPFGVLGLPALLAVFPAIGFAFARLVWTPGPARLFALAFGLGAAEWLRGHAFTGFPWNAIGLALGQNAWLMQSASLVGMDGLTAVAILICAAPATLADEGARRWQPAAVALAALTGMAIFGALRLPGEPSATLPGVKLRIVQPNVPQDDKFEPRAGAEILRRYLELSDRATSPERRGLQDVTVLIWPESAFPFLLNREPVALSRIAEALPPGTSLVTGAARSEMQDGVVRYFNAIQVVNDRGAITATYDKVHLVPFGEYVPDLLDRALRGIGLRQFVSIPGGFTPASRKTGLAVPGLPPVAAGICYEAVFSGEAVPAGARPGLLLNVTNDGWFGDTPGPRQHFAQARLRAVEQGLPLVRAANTGISAVVDPFGRVVDSLPVGRQGVLDSGLPVTAPSTLFALCGDLFFFIALILSLVLALASRRQNRVLTRNAMQAGY